MSKTILYIGGFELPDKNAAAQRVIGIAKGLRQLGYNVVFLNSVKSCAYSGVKETEYFGFKCYEYKREKEYDYLFTADTVMKRIAEIKPDAVIAYNYPAVALERIRKYGKKNQMKCYADATEWYQAVGGNIVYRAIKNFDTAYRMRWVQKKLDGVIAISRFLYDYYKDTVKTVLIPPTVDLSDEKWSIPVQKDQGSISFIYAGVPIALKEKLDQIVRSFAEVASISNNIKLNIVGVTEDQFRTLYDWRQEIPKSVVFWGRVNHLEVIQLVRQSDWAIIMRDNNRVVQAGFPTKLVESISCGTPVIVNHFSNIEDYIDASNGIFTQPDHLSEAITRALEKETNPDVMLFDYHRYLKELEELLGVLSDA